MFKSYLPIDYLCIDIANNFGDDEAVGFKGDKELFETRIQWVKDNFTVLEQRKDEAEEPYLYIKAVMALRDVLQGKKTGHLISLDAACSGIQIMSAITGCRKGGEITGQINPNIRPDAYTIITNAMNELMRDNLISGLLIRRKDAKDAVMTAGYGSKAKPLEIFGEELIEYFYEACHLNAPGAFQLLDNLIHAWQPYTLQHQWELPDGHCAHVKVMEEIETDIEVDELHHHRFTTRYKINKGSKRGVSLVANVVHSIDAYILRSLIRRTNYNPKRIQRAVRLMEKEMEHSQRTPIHNKDRMDMVGCEERFNFTNMVDALTLDRINKHTIGYLSKHHIQRLLQLAKQMLQTKPFQTLTVHDAFRCHANNCDTVRYWYKELLAELSESTILQDIITQITNRKVTYHKLSNNMATAIRNSNYTLG